LPHLRALAATVAGLALSASAAHATTVVLSDNFDGEGGGMSVPYYTGFANWYVTDGMVDLLHSAACAGGAGSCVNLDSGNHTGGALQTRQSVAFAAGDTVTLSFQVSGTQTYEDIFATFEFGGPTLVTSGTADEGYGYGTVLHNLEITGWTVDGAVKPGATFTTYAISFIAGQAGMLGARIGSKGGDGVGPVLDNVLLTICGGAIPEPSTWVLMIGGFGLAGAALRRRRALAA
jgi:hypothetical protein